MRSFCSHRFCAETERTPGLLDVNMRLLAVGSCILQCINIFISAKVLRLSRRQVALGRNLDLAASTVRDLKSLPLLIIFYTLVSDIRQALSIS